MTTTTLNPGEAHWTDRKRYLWLLSPAIPLAAFLALVAYHATGWTWLAFGGPILLYGIIPVLDWLIGEDTSNPPAGAVGELENDRYYRYIVFGYIPLQFLATLYGAWLVSQGGHSWVQVLGLILTVGTINGIAINTSHELGHKRESLERWLAKLTLAPTAYGHFFVEHNRGHHKNVATPNDPASSKMGETFWAFLPRTVSGSLRSAWHIEKERLARLGKGPWTADNENLQAWAMTVVFFGAVVAWLGVEVLPFLLLQAVFAFSLLEVVNYLEHYGLLRLPGPDGRPERCQPRHSWNSNHIVTNLVLYQLQRHSDHHAHPTRGYQALRHFEEAPALPSGYAGMILVAYFPPLWFRLMDPKVAAHHQYDLSRANVHAPRREALMKQWHRAPASQRAATVTAGGAAASAVQAPPATSRYQCNDCGYVYDEALGCPREGYAPGTRWADLPHNWPCPECAVREKPDFIPLQA